MGIKKSDVDTMLGDRRYQNVVSGRASIFENAKAIAIADYIGNIKLPIHHRLLAIEIIQRYPEIEFDPEDTVRSCDTCGHLTLLGDCSYLDVCPVLVLPIGWIPRT